MDSALPGWAGLLPALEASLNADGSARNVMRVAEAFRMAGQSAHAAEILQPIVDREPSRISPRVLLAWCLEDLGRVDDAQGMLESVRSMDPGNPFARQPEPSRPAAPASRPMTPPVMAAPPQSEAELELDLSPVAPVPESTPAREQPAPVAIVRDPETEAEPETALTEAELMNVPPSPLYSATLAEIFEKQGFEGKAIEIYEEVIRRDPERRDLRDRITDLRARLAESA